MNKLLKEIDIEQIVEECVSIDELANDIKERLERESSLKLESVFEGSEWIIENRNQKTYNYIHWDKLDGLKKFGHLSNEEELILKCWIGEQIADGTVKVVDKINTMFDILNMTNNFNEDIIKSNKGDIILSYLNGLQGRGKQSKLETIKEYLYYLEEKDLLQEGHSITFERLLLIEIQRKDKKRVLPNESDMLTFDYYLKYFFYEDDEVDDNMKMLFYPILIWWKVTTVIPMRPSEICAELKRDCLEQKGDRYYIHVKRVKVDIGNNKGRKGKIPLLSKIPITKEIFDFLNLYKEKTDWDKETKTFLSYRAMKNARAEYENYSPNLNQEKINEDYFTSNALGTLIDRFYSVVMEDMYSIEVIEGNMKITKDMESVYGSKILRRMDVGDTRHIAFTSLLLQGVSPIEIAMLGGHTSLSAQDYYQGHSMFYADSEIINLVTQRNVIHPEMDRTLKAIIMNKPEEPPRNLESCMPTEDGVGYCTIDINSEILDCIGDCIRCKHWWCEPTGENYIIVTEYVQNNIIMPIEREILNEELYLRKLLSSPKTKVIDGLLELDLEYEEDLFRTVKRINNSTVMNKNNIKSLSENSIVTEGLKKMFGGGDLWLELKEG